MLKYWGKLKRWILVLDWLVTKATPASLHSQLTYCSYKNTDECSFKHNTGMSEQIPRGLCCEAGFTVSEVTSGLRSCLTSNSGAGARCAAHKVYSCVGAAPPVFFTLIYSLVVYWHHPKTKTWRTKVHLQDIQLQLWLLFSYLFVDTTAVAADRIMIKL